MKLIPIAMIVPTKRGIYAPSRIEGAIEIDSAEFAEKYADNAQTCLVSFAKDGQSNPSQITTYSDGNLLGKRFVVQS